MSALSKYKLEIAIKIVIFIALSAVMSGSCVLNNVLLTFGIACVISALMVLSIFTDVQKYYFVTFVTVVDGMQIRGRGYFSLKGTFVIRDVEGEISRILSRDNVTVLDYRRVSRVEYLKNR